MNKTDITDASVTILLEFDGNVHFVAMEKEKKEAIESLIKSVTKTLVNTEVTQYDLIRFLDPEGKVT